MGLFRKKQATTFIANVTRATIGDTITTPDGTKVPANSIDDKTLIGTPQATASMMIYEYCNSMYANPATNKKDALAEILRKRGIDKWEIDLLLNHCGDSLFKLINAVVGEANAFSVQELNQYVSNIRQYSPIFKEVEVA